MPDKFQSCFGDPIEGLIVAPQRRIIDGRGGILHMLKSTDSIFKGFGEIYFSFANPGIVKAWHVHSRMFVNNCIVSGTAKLVCHDLREGSSSFGHFQEIYLGRDNYCTVQIPPGVANGYMAIGNQPALLANCASIAHDPDEISYIDPIDGEIEYDWDVRHG